MQKKIFITLNLFIVLLSLDVQAMGRLEIAKALVLLLATQGIHVTQANQESLRDKISDALDRFDKNTEGIKVNCPNLTQPANTISIVSCAFPSGEPLIMHSDLSASRNESCTLALFANDTELPLSSQIPFEQIQAYCRPNNKSAAVMISRFDRRFDENPSIFDFVLFNKNSVIRHKKLDIDEQFAFSIDPVMNQLPKIAPNDWATLIAWYGITPALKGEVRVKMLGIDGHEKDFHFEAPDSNLQSAQEFGTDSIAGNDLKFSPGIICLEKTSQCVLMWAELGLQARHLVFNRDRKESMSSSEVFEVLAEKGAYNPRPIVLSEGPDTAKMAMFYSLSAQILAQIVTLQDGILVSDPTRNIQISREIGSAYVLSNPMREHIAVLLRETNLLRYRLINMKESFKIVREVTFGKNSSFMLPAVTLDEELTAHVVFSRNDGSLVEREIKKK